MASRPKFGDLVIIVPGILGSRLVITAFPSGGIRARFCSGCGPRRRLAHLAVGGDDPSLEDLGDASRPTA